MTHSETDIPRTSPRDDHWSRLLTLVGGRRDQAAFAQLFAHFAPLIKGFCLANPSRSLPGEAADELVQEVMFKVWMKAPGFDAGKAAASTWIFAVTRNCRIDLMRRNSRHQFDAAEIDVEDIWSDESDHQPLVWLQQSRNSDLVHTSFAALPQEQKQVLAQVYIQGKSHGEIAAETGLPLGTVKSRVRMGLKKLQATIGKR
jgi:RNA polymerase sigma factor (sigma-70 family)